MFHRLRSLLVLAVVLALLPLTTLAHSHTLQDPSNEQYFPETGHTVSGRLLEYWRANGGLPVFGFPLTDAHNEVNSSNDYGLTQYFERQRFELHPENQAPYDVLLGRLGAEVLQQQGVDVSAIPRVEPLDGCFYFAETGHNVCDQAAGKGFLSYWRSHGLNFGDENVSYRESLALFGYPLTEAQVLTNPDGDTVIGQYFERARFEWHADNPDPYKVLLGRLGAEVLEQQPLPPLVDQVRIALIATDSGGTVGCGDSVVTVQRQVTPTTAPLHAAMIDLLSIKEQRYGQSGLYNALYQSDLHVDSIALNAAGTATIRLSGNLVLGGVCDGPRVEAQLRQTALQFGTVSNVDIYVNGRPLAEVLSQR